jgi:drug/metabolite transporter (DMT)-like permease
MAVVAKSMADLPRLGIVLMLAAWLLFSWVDTGAKWLAVAGFSAFQLAFMRYAGHFVISIGVIAKDGFMLERFQTGHVWQVISRALLLVSATLSNFYALQFLPLTVVSAIMFSSPVVVCFLSVSVLRERVEPWRWGVILLGFIGVLIVVRPFGTAFHPGHADDHV